MGLGCEVDRDGGLNSRGSYRNLGKGARGSPPHSQPSKCREERTKIPTCRGRRAFQNGSRPREKWPVVPPHPNAAQREEGECQPRHPALNQGQGKQGRRGQHHGDGNVPRPLAQRLGRVRHQLQGGRLSVLLCKPLKAGVRFGWEEWGGGGWERQEGPFLGTGFILQQGLTVTSDCMGT